MLCEIAHLSLLSSTRYWTLTTSETYNMSACVCLKFEHELGRHICCAVSLAG